jgi:hypothetical protein
MEFESCNGCYPGDTQEGERPPNWKGGTAPEYLRIDKQNKLKRRDGARDCARPTERAESAPPPPKKNVLLWKHPNKSPAAYSPEQLMA